MEESIWYEKQRSQIEESLWYLKQRHQNLQDYRQTNERQWDDQASVYINGRYLNPHQEDSEKMSQLLHQQHQTLTQTDTYMNLANNYGQEVQKLSAEIESLIEFAQQDLQRSYHNYHNYLDNNLTAKAELPIIANLINQANNAC